MTQEKYEEIIGKLGYERDKWLLLHEIDRIQLRNGRGIYPNWRHLRFMLKKDKLLIQHGKSYPYGARLNGAFDVSSDHMAIYFKPGNRGLQLDPSSFYTEGFRQPKVGDTIKVTEGHNKQYGQSIIKDIKRTIDSIMVFLWTPIKFPSTGRVSFFDTDIFNTKADNCIHGNVNEGIYMVFEPNKSKKIYQEEIKIKDILSIDLLIGREFFNKTYILD